MIPLLTRAQVREAERTAAAERGAPTLSMMERAGEGAARAVTTRFAAFSSHVVIVGGTGQNGGDAWVVARHLLRAGISSRCVLVGDPAKVAGDARTNLDALRALGVALAVVGAPGDVEGAIGSDVTLVVDGLFGTGLDRPITGAAAAVIDRVNELRAVAERRRTRLPIVALDLPSGIDADTGQVLGVAVRATLTTTFGAHKRGLWQHPGRDHAGEIELVDIGVELGFGADPADRAWLDDAPDGRLHLARRAADSHKGDSGRVVLFAGAPGTTGAALLAARGALRAGAGLVTVVPRPEARVAVDAKSLESMTAALPAGDGADAVNAAVELAARADAAVLGPGFGHADGLAFALALALPVPTVLDADALTALAPRPESLRGAAALRVLTPHPGEAARLLGSTSVDVQRDRYAAARLLARRAGHVVVLKGAATVVAAPDGRVVVCSRGTPALATGGTGDVLAGIVGALLARDSITSAARTAQFGTTPSDGFEAAHRAVLWHALAGEHAAHGADRGLLAHEVADALPYVLTSD